MTDLLGGALPVPSDDGTEHFPPSFDVLLAEFPQHMRGAQEDTGELRTWIAALAAYIDQLSLAAEDVYADGSLATATPEGLREEWAQLYGLGNEIANLTTEQLRGYIEAWAKCDGSTQSVTNLLLAIINLDPANDGGAVLTFDAGGAGLTFPADGSGLTMYQYATKPAQTVGFVFPDGGIQFPSAGLVMPADGSGLTFPGDGSGLTFPTVTDLTFPNNAWVVLTETFLSYALTVTVKSYLSFDRGAFQRAIARFAQAHVTTSYVESNT